MTSSDEDREVKERRRSGRRRSDNLEIISSTITPDTIDSVKRCRHPAPLYQSGVAL